MPPLVTANVKRREVRFPPIFTPASRNVRPVEQVYPHQSPDQIRYGETPCRPARMPIVTFLAIAPFKAVQADEFHISILNPYFHAQTLDGGQLTWEERENIRKNPAEAYGSLVLLDPPDPYPFPA